jgi:hypothetical protein
MAEVLQKVWANSGDSHLLEPADLFVKTLPRAMAARMPRSEKFDDHELVHIDGQTMKRRLPKPIREGEVKGKLLEEVAMRPPDSHDAKLRMLDLDAEGIWGGLVPARRDGRAHPHRDGLQERHVRQRLSAPRGHLRPHPADAVRVVRRRRLTTCVNRSRWARSSNCSRTLDDRRGERPWAVRPARPGDLMSGTTVWISGATEGLGLGLARTCPYRDARTINLSRRQHPDPETVRFDLTDPSTWDTLAEHLQREVADFAGERAIFIENAYFPDGAP